MSVWVWIGVALLGGIGAWGRFLLDGLIAGRIGRDFPFGTLTINVTGALLLGLLAGLALMGNALVLVGTATLGAYTTFSTWMFETHRLAEDDEIRTATVNILFSLAAGIGAAALGRAIGAHL